MNRVERSQYTINVKPTAGHMYVIERKDGDQPLSSFINDGLQWTNDGRRLHPNVAKPTLVKTDYSNAERRLQRFYYHPLSTSDTTIPLLRRFQPKPNKTDFVLILYMSRGTKQQQSDRERPDTEVKFNTV